MTTPGRSNVRALFVLILGIVVITAGMAVGLGRIGDALVMNNPEAGTLFNPANVSMTTTIAGLIIGSTVAVGSAMIALSVRKWK